MAETEGVYAKFPIFKYFNDLLYVRDRILTNFLTTILTNILTSEIYTD